MTIEFQFKCTKCAEWHTGLPDLAFDAPYYYEQLSEEQKLSIAIKTDDTCSIDNEDFFVRGVIRIPIIGSDTDFAWGAWVSLSPANFQRYLELFEAVDRVESGPYFGWLSNRLPGYPDTLALKTHVHLQPYPQRPEIELEHTDHPLAVHQRNGLHVEVLQATVESALHPAG